ncbi:MAG: divergent polysaccharide deacetylase family protein [Magnetococcales bacterium]|nr:divergent polysaccharide deacetylase family protein [Magnetococcales bacterium]
MNGQTPGNWQGKLRWLVLLLVVVLAGWGAVRWLSHGSRTVATTETTVQSGAPLFDKPSEPLPVPAPTSPTVSEEEPLRLILAENIRGTKPLLPVGTPPLESVTVAPSGPDLTFVAPSPPASGETPPAVVAEPPASAPPAASASRTTPEPILYEEPVTEPKKERPSRPRPAAASARSDRMTGTLAIVIDDLGYDWPHSKAIAELPADITLAILPRVPFSRDVARLGKKLGKEMLLHQPMEPMRYPHTSPGPGAMLVQMDASRWQTILRENLSQLPEVVGINNHMGSRLTEHTAAMDATMQVLLDKQLFFIDSRTSDNSIAADRANANQVPTAVRDVFLDNTAEEGAILRQLHRLERLALSHGEAIGIGHPYRATVAALQQWLPTLPGKGIRLQRVSRFLRPVEARARYPEQSATASNQTERPTRQRTELPSGAVPPALAEATSPPTASSGD